jgi:hypothetical protein
VERLAVLIDAGVGVAIDSLDHPLDTLECHLLILVILRDDLMLLLPLSGRCAIISRLQLLLLMELLRK